MSSCDRTSYAEDWERRHGHPLPRRMAWGRDWDHWGITYEEALKLAEPGERVYPDDCCDPRYEEEMAYWDAEEEAEE